MPTKKKKPNEYGKKPNGKNDTGRPSKLTPEVLAKLETYFKAAMTDEEACQLAEIHPSVLYRYCEEHPEFRDKKEWLKKDTTGRAKQVVRMAILDKDAKAAMWWLERKAKADFGNSTKIEMPEPVRVYVKDYEYENKVLDHIDAVTGDGTRKEHNTDQGQSD